MPQLIQVEACKQLYLWAVSLGTGTALSSKITSVDNTAGRASERREFKARLRPADFPPPLRSCLREGWQRRASLGSQDVLRCPEPRRLLCRVVKAGLELTERGGRQGLSVLLEAADLPVKAWKKESKLL